jgi:hypothetical protein
MPEQLDLVAGHPRLNEVGQWGPGYCSNEETLLDEPLDMSEDVALCPFGHPYVQR